MADEILNLIIDARQAVTGAQQFDAAVETVGTSATQAAADNERLQGSMDATGAVMIRQTRSARSVEAAYDRVRRQVDPLYAAQQKLSRQTEVVDAAFRRGIITEEEQARTLAQLQAVYDQVAARQNAATVAQTRSTAATVAATRAAQQHTTGTRIQGFAVQNLSFQLQDVLVQASSGTNAFRILAQQGPQIASVFGPAGAVLGIFVAGLGAAGAAVFGLERETASLKAAQEAADRTAKALDQTIAKSAESADELARKYRALTAEMRALEGVSLAAAMRSIAEEQNAIDKQITTSIAKLERNRAQAEQSARQRQGGPTADVQLMLDTFATLDRFRADRNATALVVQLDKLAAAGGTTGRALQSLNDDLIEPAKRMIDTRRQSERLAAALKVLEGSATAADRALIDSDSTRERSAAAGERLAATTRNLRSELEQQIGAQDKLIAAYAQGPEAVARLTREQEVLSRVLGMNDKAVATNLAAFVALATQHAENQKVIARLKAEFALDEQVASTRRLADATTLGNAALREAEIANETRAKAVELGIVGDEKAVGALRAKITALKDESAALATSNRLNELRADAAVTQRELELVGASDRARQRDLAMLRETMTALRREGKDRIEDLTEESRKAIDLAGANADLNSSLREQQAAYEELENIGVQAFDRIGEAITQALATGQLSMAKLGDMGKAVLSELLQGFLRLAAINPLRNMAFGTALPTLGSVSSAAAGTPTVPGGSTGFGIGDLGGIGRALSGGFDSLTGAINSFGASAFGLASGGQAAGTAASLGVAAVPGGMTNAALSPAAGALGSTTLSGLLGGVGAGFGVGTLLGSLMGRPGTGNMIGSGVGSVAGAIIGSAVFGPAGTLLGGILGGGAGGFFGSLFGGGKPKKPQFGLLTMAGTEPGGPLNDSFRDGFSVESAFGNVGLSGNLTRKAEDGFVRDVVRRVAIVDDALAGLLTDSEVSRAARRLQANEATQETAKEFDPENLGDMLIDRFTHVGRAVGISFERIAESVGTLEDAMEPEEVTRRMGALLEERRALKRLIDNTGEMGGIIDAVAEKVRAATETVGKLGAANDDFGFSAAGAAAAQRRLVEEMLGIREAPEALSELTKAFATLNQVFEQTAELAEQVGISEAARAAALVAGQEKIAAGYQEGIDAALLAFRDPLAASLEEQRKIAEARLRDVEAIYRESGVRITGVEELNARERARIIEQFGQQANAGLQKLRDDLVFGQLGGVAPVPAVNAQRSAFEAAAAQALASPADMAARARVAELGRLLTGTSRDTFGSSAQFQRDREMVLGTVNRLLGQHPATLAGNDNARIVGAVQDLKPTLEAIGSETARGNAYLLAEVRALNRKVADLTDQLARRDSDIHRLARAKGV